MKCPQCQTENPEDNRFCRECGARIVLACPDCKAEISPGDKFCGKCGHSLSEPAAAPPIDYTEPQSYTPKFLADKILTTRSSIEGERKLVTVLFADVANYTTISEKLDPEEVHQIMDGCFKILMDEIHKYEGTINQFTGDGVMALFGAPVAHEDHAQRACHAAISIQTALWEYGEKIKKDTGVEFKIRIGLNSGPVIVGSIGDDLRMDYTAVGDTTNLASRMEDLARPGTAFVSHDTHKLARDYFEFKSLGKVEIKGKEEPVEAYELIKTGEIVTRIEAAAAKGLTRFVGRKNSMVALMEAYEKVQAGSGQVVGMVGEAGVGKSRLLLEFRNRLAQSECTYLDGRCLHYGGSMPYLPILDILRAYFEIKEDDREFVIKKKMEEKILQLDENLKGLLPSFQDLLSLKVEDETYLKLEPKQKRDMAFEAIRDLIIRESQNRTVIVAVEDLHWIDKTSEEFLNYLIGWLANARVLLVLLYRPEYTHQWGSKSYYSHIGLDQLTIKSSAELIQAILEGGEVVPELRELILNRAAGNPLFMEEFTHTLLENGSIQRKDHHYVLSRKPSDIQVPDTIQGIIAARMDRLEDNLKRTMQVASVIGRDFAFRILQTITGMREELKSYLLNLQGLEFIYEKQLFPELEYIFKHALTQEVAYNSLLAKRRGEIHKRIGEAIEALYPERLEEFYEMLAYHYSKGEDPGKACHYLKLSGNKATRNHALWEAYGFYREAIRLLNRLTETEDNKRALIEVIELTKIPTALLGYPEDSLTIFQQGERLSKELGDAKSLAIFYGAMGSYYSLAGDHLMAIKYTEDAFEEARKTQDIELMVPLAYSLCIAYQGTGESYKMADKAPEVIELLEKTGKESEFFAAGINPYSFLCGNYGRCLGHLGDFEEGKAFLEKGLRHAIQVNDLASLGNAEGYYGIFFYTKGDWEPAKEHLEKSIKYSEGAKWTLGLALGLSFLGHVHSFLGNPEIGRLQVEKGLQILRETGIEFMLSINHLVLGGIHLDLGDLENARNSVEEALRLSRKNNEKGWEGLSLIWLGRILGRTEPRQIEKVEEYIFKGLEILRDVKRKPDYSQGYLFLGEFYLDAGEKEKALENLKKAESMFKEMGMNYWLARTYALYADLYKKEGDQSKAKEQLEKAIGILRDLSADGWVEKYEKELAALS